MIRIRTNEEIENYEICLLFDNSNHLIGEIKSGLILTDVLLQIKINKLSGYYIVFNSEITIIESDGSIRFDGKKPFSSLSNMLRDLI